MREAWFGGRVRQARGFSPGRSSSNGRAPDASMYRRLRLCSNSGGYEAIPEPSLHLDLAKARGRLEQEGIAVVDARAVLVAAMDPEATISRSGSLLFKTRDAAAAERALERLTSLMAPPGAPVERMIPS